jgi:hypothetical protein
VLNCHQDNAAGSSLVESPVHIFHQDCITQWFFKKIECPMCRKSFKDELLQSVRNQEEENGEDLDESMPGDDDVINLNDGRINT